MPCFVLSCEAPFFMFDAEAFKFCLIYIKYQTFNFRLRKESVC